MAKIKGEQKESKVGKIMKAPLRALIKARDLYIQSMTQCSTHFDYGAAIGCPTAHVNTLPRSLSVSSAKSTKNTEDFRELAKAASARSLGSKIDDQHHKLDLRKSTASGARPHNLPKSRSVGFSRIDEDKACDEFEENVDEVIRTTNVYPRSRSSALHRRTLF